MERSIMDYLWHEYEKIKRKWIEENPNGTQEQYDLFIKKLVAEKKL